MLRMRITLLKIQAVADAEYKQNIKAWVTDECFGNMAL